MKRFAAICWLVFAAFAQAREWYVSPRGNDHWSGLQAEANADGTDGPFATLERARDAARLTGGDRIINLRAGTYFLPHGFDLTAVDSGSPGRPVIWRAYRNEKPVLTAGVAIARWQPWKNGIWSANLKGTPLDGVAFTQLFAGGRRQILARYPNYDPKNPIAGGWAYVAGPQVGLYTKRSEDSKNQFPVQPSDWRAWSKPSEVQIVIFPRFNWWNNVLPIQARHPGENSLTTSKNASYAIRPGDRFYFQGALEELDAPDEWYLDHAASTVYFLPGTPQAPAKVIAPLAVSILRLHGLHDLNLVGLILEYTEADAIRIEDATRCRVENCTIRNVGNYQHSGLVISGGRDVGVQGCEIHDVGCHGVTAGGGDLLTLTPARHVIDDCRIYRTGIDYKQGVGVLLEGVGQRVSHCLIYDEPRFAVMFHGNHQIVEYNEIHHVALETEDVGAIYCGGRNWIDVMGSVIRYNLIYDVPGFGWAGSWQSPHEACGIYLDDHTGFVDVIGNIIVNCGESTIHANCSFGCRIENNLLIADEGCAIKLTGWTVNTPHWKDCLPQMQSSYASVKNQPAWKEMRGIEISPDQSSDQQGFLMRENAFSKNIILCRGSTPAAFRLQNVEPGENHFGRNLYWSEKNNAEFHWQIARLDPSGTIADPLVTILNPQNYHIAPDSPAWKIGFQPLPVGQMGLIRP